MNVLQSFFRRRPVPDGSSPSASLPAAKLAHDPAQAARPDDQIAAARVALQQDGGMPVRGIEPDTATPDVLHTARQIEPILPDPPIIDPSSPISLSLWAQPTDAPVQASDWIPKYELVQGTTETLPPIKPAEPPVATNSPTDIGILLRDFETLGDNPEFGLVRQALGAGPDGLLGFGTMYPNALITLLKTRFAGFGEPANLAPRTAFGVYYVDDKRLGLSWRTEIKEGQMDEAGVIAHEADRLTKLRGQLIANLTANRRLFVYAGHASDTQVLAIRTAMQAYGANTLLHLVIATQTKPAGHVTRHERGLLHGYLTKYGNETGRWDIAMDDWVTICRTAHRLWRPLHTVGP